MSYHYFEIPPVCSIHHSENCFKLADLMVQFALDMSCHGLGYRKPMNIWYITAMRHALKWGIQIFGQFRCIKCPLDTKTKDGCFSMFFCKKPCCQSPNPEKNSKKQISNN